MRLVFFCQIDMLANVTWNAPGTMSWTLVETGVYLIAATLPSLRPLMPFFLKGFKLKTPYHKLLGRCSRVFSAHKHLEGSTSAGNGARLAGFVKMKDVKPLDQKATHEEWV